MRLISIRVEDHDGDMRYVSERRITGELLGEVRRPGDILLLEYRRAKRELEANMRKARIAGPKGKLP